MLDRPIAWMRRFPVRWDGVEVGRCRRIRDWRTTTPRSAEQLVEQEGSTILALDFDDSVERVQPLPRLGRVDISLRAHSARFLPMFLPQGVIFVRAAKHARYTTPAAGTPSPSDWQCLSWPLSSRRELSPSCLEIRNLGVRLCGFPECVLSPLLVACSGAEMRRWKRPAACCPELLAHHKQGDNRSATLVG